MHWPQGPLLNSTAATPLAQLTLEPILGWWMVWALAAITLASLWLTLTATEISVRGRGLLAGLRLLATIVLLVGWLRPAVLSTSTRETEGAVAVLLDRSQSMTLPSATVGKTRWDVQREVWEALAEATGLQIGGSTLVPYLYDRELVPVAESDWPSLRAALSGQPEGRATDLGRALAEVARAQVSPPLRAVVLVGDGAQTQLPPQHDPLLIARQLAQLDQPIYFVGLGARGESSLVKDVAVEGLPEEITAFANKEVNVPLVISAQGMQNEPIEVSLVLRSSGQPDRELRRRRVLPSQSAEKIPLEFRVQLDEPGDYMLIAQARVDATEQVTSNNQSLSFVSVREGGVRILLLEGQPRYEQLYLKASLDASIDFDVEYAWLPPRSRANWPIDISRGIDLASFEVYIVGDLDARAVQPNNWQRIASRINQGAGLMMLGGYHSFDAGGYQESPLAQALPVLLQTPRQQWNQPINQRLHILEPVPLVPTRPHPITSLLPEPENTRLWESLKPMDGMNRFSGLSTAPGTQVLLSSPQGAPALVAGQYGSGRVLAFAADTTWRWYTAGEESGQKRAHQTFWRQAILWLVNREKLQEGFRLSIDSRRQDIDATPRVRAEWYGGSDESPPPSQIKLSLSREQQFLRNLDLATIGDNVREATVSGLDQPGLYSAELTASGPDGTNYSAELVFWVQDNSRELAQAAADWQMMSNLVAAGAAAGSELFLPEDVSKLITQLRQRQEASQMLITQRRRLGDTAGDSWLYLVLFAGLMSAEWALRKRWQMP